MPGWGRSPRGRPSASPGEDSRGVRDRAARKSSSPIWRRVSGCGPKSHTERRASSTSVKAGSIIASLVRSGRNSAIGAGEVGPAAGAPDPAVPKSRSWRPRRLPVWVIRSSGDQPIRCGSSSSADTCGPPSHSPSHSAASTATPAPTRWPTAWATRGAGSASTCSPKKRGSGPEPSSSRTSQAASGRCSSTRWSATGDSSRSPPSA